ncbi:hypothetical protein, partial [Mangrovihabitans endophyticus]|uniref:hypothetical protein n=1 Tax=Mangrovihabitans endophyticus TaxID=1751298 RepID=UPI00227BE3E2
MASPTFIDPGSVLARTAREMLAAHGGGTGPRDGTAPCPVCGEPLPCASGRAAAEVLFAAGLAEESGLISAARPTRAPESPLGVPASSAPAPTGVPASSPGAPSPSPAPAPAAGSPASPSASGSPSASAGADGALVADGGAPAG